MYPKDYKYTQKRIPDNWWNPKFRWNSSEKFSFYVTESTVLALQNAIS